MKRTRLSPGRDRPARRYGSNVPQGCRRHWSKMAGGSHPLKKIKIYLDYFKSLNMQELYVLLPTNYLNTEINKSNELPVILQMA